MRHPKLGHQIGPGRRSVFRLPSGSEAQPPWTAVGSRSRLSFTYICQATISCLLLFMQAMPVALAFSFSFGLAASVLCSSPVWGGNAWSNGS